MEVWFMDISGSISEVFLAKKNRLNGLKSICFEYVQSMYYTQSITPVTVRVAQRLTETQMEKVKQKMKEKAGTRDTRCDVCWWLGMTDQ